MTYAYRNRFPEPAYVTAGDSMQEEHEETVRQVEGEMKSQLRICHGLAKQSLSKLDIYPEHTPEHLDAALHALQDAMDELGILEEKP